MRRLAILALAMVIAGLGLFFGNGGSAGAGSGQSESGGTSMGAVDPSSVDRASYAAAFDKYRACLESVGAHIEDSEVDARTGQVSWSVVVDDDKAAAAEGCYEAFRAIDEAYAVKNADLAAATDDDQIEHFRRHVAPCLTVNGIDFEVPETTSSPEWARLNELFMELAAAGKCPGITAQE